MPKSAEVLNEMEKVLAEIVEDLSNKAKPWRGLTAEEFAEIDSFTAHARKIRKLTEGVGSSISKRKTLHEQMKGKDIKEVRKYDCEKYSGDNTPEIIIFEDGIQKMSCEFLDLEICSRCEHFKAV